MSIISFAFTFFFLFSWAAYYLTPRTYRWVVLLICSAAFYLLADARTMVFLLFAVLVTYFAGLLLGRQNQRMKSAMAAPGAEKAAVKRTFVGRKRWTVFAALMIVFGALFAVKYLDFCFRLLDPLYQKLGWTPLPELKLLLPLGISFYTFQAAGYVFDVYRAKCEPERNPAKHALFLMFFPQIIQGPISRRHELAGQLYEGHTFSMAAIESASYRILWGYFKKIVIADRLIVTVANAFNLEQGYTGLSSFLGAALYCLQIYADFSGGIDIVMGVAEGFGVALPENFRQPFFAQSLNAFWQRWHITLGRWMREYVFYPIAISGPMARLSKKLKQRSAYLARAVPSSIGTVAVFFIVGVWHGAALYCLQIYADFSGGIDIVMGVAEGFGVALPENFRQPFFAQSLNAFWQRWHITLGRWMREYVFYPIAISGPMARLSKKLKQRSAYLARAVPSSIGPVAVFFIVGVWHGAALKYIVFGLYFAALICLGTFCAPLNDRIVPLLRVDRKSRWFTAFSVLRTDALCVIGFFFARADRLSDALTLIRRTLAGLGTPVRVDMSMTVPNQIVMLLAVLLLLAVSILKERGVELRAVLMRRTLALRWATFFLLLAVLLVFGAYGPGYAASDFIYMGF